MRVCVCVCVWSQTQRDPHVFCQWHIYVFFTALTAKTKMLEILTSWMSFSSILCSPARRWIRCVVSPDSFFFFACKYTESALKWEATLKWEETLITDAAAELCLFFYLGFIYRAMSYLWLSCLDTVVMYKFGLFYSALHRF